MRIVPVLDVMQGQVVRGVAGKRENYRPYRSPLCPGCDPLDFARTFRARFGFGEIYLADLDALGGEPPALSLYRRLAEEGFALWVDAGLREARQGEALIAAGVGSLVAGLETLAGPKALGCLVTAFGGERVVFSLDLKEGRTLVPTPSWNTADPREIAAAAVDQGVRRLLVLDLARVGVDGGTGTEELCRRIAAEHPDVELAAGGGIRGEDDLARLEACGVRAALIASALHLGKIPVGRTTDSSLMDR